MARVAFTAPSTLAVRSALHPPKRTCGLPLSSRWLGTRLISCAPTPRSRRPSSPHIVVAQRTQQEIPWNTVPIVENSDHCEDHKYIVLKVGVTDEKGSLCDAYRVPGMYVQIRHPDAPKPGFFAISCAPNLQGYFEFIVKRTDATEWLTDLPLGALVEVSPVQGKGFPMSKLDILAYPPIPDEDKPLDIICMATGSGIAPIRAAIESRLNGIIPQQRRSVKLYYGSRYPERMPYTDRFRLWQEDGVEVVPVMSRPGEAMQEWTGRTGYVQDALREDGIAAPRQTGVLLCGVKGMVEDVKAYCLEQGVPEDRLLLNF